MKKTNNFLKIFSPVIRFFDRWIVTPITKILLFITDYFKSNNKGFEKVLNNRQALVIISLLFALLSFYVIDQRKISLVDENAEILYGIDVNAEYNKETYVIEGLPEVVDVTLIGKQSNVYLAKQYPAKEITVDLSDLKPGTHKVSLNYKQDVSSVEYKVDPSVVTVVVYKKISEVREISYDIIHKDSLNSKLNIENVVLSKDVVTIKGAEYKLKQVASIKALVDVAKLPSQEIGKQTLKEVQLVAYDSEGQIVDVEIVPGTLEAEVTIASPSKTVPIKLITEGELDGKAIKSLTSSVSEVTLYGSQSALNKIEALEVPIDISGISSDKNYTINLSNPTGIRELSVKTITVKLVVDEVVSSEIKDVKINIENLGNGLVAQAFDENSSSVTVIAKGSQTVIDKLDKNGVYAYIDLEGKGVGEHEVEVKVVGDDNKVNYYSRTKKVTIIITKK